MGNGKKAKQVESIKHKDKRVNIPTEELRDFVADEEKAPKTILYPRDPSLDPQLVWKGKDEQDSRPLEVPAVPIYIQEKIHPQATTTATQNFSNDRTSRYVTAKTTRMWETASSAALVGVLTSPHQNRGTS